MKPQNFRRRRDATVVRRFVEERRAWRKLWHHDPPQLKLSWSSWCFGTEPLAVSAARLARNDVHYIELHGDLLPRNRRCAAVAEARTVLGDYGVRVAGICAAVTPDQEFASDQPRLRRRAVDAVRRQADLCAELGGSYVLFGAGTVGLPVAGAALERCAASIREVAEYLGDVGIRGAILPACPKGGGDCCPLVATERLLRLIDHPGVAHLNGALSDLLAVEDSLGPLLLEHGHLFANLHLADPDRQGLDRSLVAVGLVLMSLYSVGYNLDCAAGWCTPEPLCGRGPYHANLAPADPAALDALVARTARRFYECEEAMLAAADDELLGLVGLVGERSA